MSTDTVILTYAMEMGIAKDRKMTLFENSYRPTLMCGAEK
jgi:hypothetical protein